MCSWGERAKATARRLGNNETSARASSEALEAAPLRVLEVQLRIEHNAVDGALANRAHVFRDAPAAEAIRAGDVRTARDARRHLDGTEADRALMHTCVKNKFRASHSTRRISVVDFHTGAHRRRPGPPRNEPICAPAVCRSSSTARSRTRTAASQEVIQLEAAAAASSPPVARRRPGRAAPVECPRSGSRGARGPITSRARSARASPRRRSPLGLLLNVRRSR